MTIYFFDSLAKELREFFPLNEQRVQMYVCGITPYSEPHLGNFRGAVVFDNLYRLLMARFGNSAVHYVKNYTDIDDKLVAKARENGSTVREIAEENILLHDQMAIRLNILPPWRSPRATESVATVIEMLQRLIENNHAYVSEGHVLFRVSSAVPSFSDGVLLRSGARIAPENYKESPEDFVLWKPAKADEPFWESPWGNGRMGWHAECSSLVHDNLEGVIDIHGGGADLLFPHHECEIMQSENAYGHRLTNYWLHNGMLTVDGQKMAKSVGNVVLVSSALRTAHGEALRYLLMTAHYRQPLDFTRERLDEAQANMDRLYGALEAVWDGDIVVGEFVPTDVLKALENDLNTPEALAALHALADRAYKASEPAERLEIREQILAAGKLLGLFQMSPEKWFRGMIAPEDRPEIERWIEHREQARRNKNFKLSDAVRDRLRTLFWIEIEDTPQGPKWRRVRNWIANIYEE